MSRLVIALLLALAVTVPANAATLVLTNGKLSGARNVTVANVLYDVEFRSGSCVEVFADCSSGAQFTFDAAGAQLASKALLAEVFVGQYDDDPTLTRGITNTAFGDFHTPSSVNTNGALNTFIARNAGPASNKTDGTGSGGPNPNDPLPAGDALYAVWTTSLAVPLPAAFWLLASAMGVLLGLGRLRKQRADV